MAPPGSWDQVPRLASPLPLEGKGGGVGKGDLPAHVRQKCGGAILIAPKIIFGALAMGRIPKSGRLLSRMTVITDPGLLPKIICGPIRKSDFVRAGYENAFVVPRFCRYDNASNLVTCT